MLSVALLAWAVVATSATSFYYFRSSDLERQVTSFDRRSAMGLAVVVVDYANGSKDTFRVFFQIGRNDSAFNATLAALGDEVAYTYYPSFGDVLVNSIGGVVGNSTHFWALYVNGQFSAQGAMNTKLYDGDRVVWNFTKVSF